MGRRSIGRILGIACVMFSAGDARAQDSLKDRFVLVGTEAIGLMPPELVCGPSVTQAKWSEDGRWVMAVCRAERVDPALARTRALTRDPKDPPGDLSLVVWSRDSHRAHELWRRPLSRANVEEIRWLPDSTKAVAIVSESIPLVPGFQSRREVLWLRADSDSARIVAEIPFDDHPPGWIGSPDAHYLDISPSRPIVLITHNSVTERKLQMTDGKTRTLHSSRIDLTPIRDDGRIAPIVQLPQDVEPIVWSESGSTYYLQRIDYSPDPAQRPARVWFEYDPRSGDIKQLPAEPPTFKALMEARHPVTRGDVPAPTGPVHLVAESAEVKRESTAARSRPLWLEAAGQSSQPRALVSLDSSWSSLSPRGDAVLYLSGGSAWVRPLMRVTEGDYAAMLHEERRRQAVADAGELARALQRQVGDREFYPKPDQVAEWLGPYVKDKDLFARLVYTFAGGLPPKNPEDWATTPLGFVTGPGGRAIIFADGHAAWQDD